MVLKIGASRRYEPLPQGLRALTALGGPARKGNPTLARRQHSPEPDSKLSQPTPVDQHYENLRAGMRGLVTEPGMTTYYKFISWTICFSSLG